MLRSSLFVAAALTGLASAQGVSNQTISQDCPGYTIQGGNYTFPTSCIPEYFQNTWCNAEKNTCSTVCDDNVSNDNNFCSSDDLTYRCICDNGFTPNISNYQQSLPSLMCAQWRIFCTNAHPNDMDGQTMCQSVICGNETAVADPRASTSNGGSPTTTGSDGSSSETPSPTTGGSGSDASSGSNPTDTPNFAAPLRVGHEYGVAIVGTGLLALFGFAL